MQDSCDYLQGHKLQRKSYETIFAHEKSHSNSRRWSHDNLPEKAIYVRAGL